MLAKSLKLNVITYLLLGNLKKMVPQKSIQKNIQNKKINKIMGIK